MQVIIVGCGKLGITLAEALVSEKHDVTVVEINSQRLDTISNSLDIQGVVGNGASVNVLLEAGLDKADILISVTASDELNLLCCLIAKKVRNVHTIARVRNPVYSKELGFIKEELGLSMIINPEHAAASEVARLLSVPSAIQIERFAKGRVELHRFRVPKSSVLSGMQVMDINSTLKTDILVCSIEHEDELTIASGISKIEENDIISIVASRANTQIFFEKIGLVTDPVKNTLIIGGGEISFYLSDILINMGIRVKIIEKDEERCDELSELLPKAMIINGDGTDKNILDEEGLRTAQGIATMTNMDEENILLSLYAKTQTKGKIVTKLNSINYDEIVSNLEIDSTVYPKYIAAEYILQYVRAMQNSIGSNVETLYRLCDNKVEALEFVVKDEPLIVGKQLANLNLKPNVLIGCINRHNNTIIIPRGHDVINPGDTVIIVTTQSGLCDIKDILL